MVNWVKDRNRRLKSRALAEDFAERQQLQAASPIKRVAIKQDKATLREIGEAAFRSFKKTTP